MTDERNIAHDKKVMEEKKHEGVDITEGTVHDPQPGKKPEMEKDEDGAAVKPEETKAEA